MTRTRVVAHAAILNIACAICEIGVPCSQALAINIQIEQTLTPSVSGSGFGSSLALSGDVAIIGVTGFAEIERFSNGQWSHEATLLPSSGTGFYASDVDIRGDLAIVGDWEGQLAYVYRYNGTNWVEEALFKPSGNGPFTGFGSSVAISANRAVVGSFGDGGSGAAYVYKFDQGAWSLEQKIVALDIASNDFFGQSVDISGNVVLVGATWADAGTPNSGAAYFYDFDGAKWQQIQKVTGQGTITQAFGVDVTLDSNRAIIGSWGDSNVGAFSGSAYVFDRTPNGWEQQAKLVADNATERDLFGRYVSLSGDSVAVGTGGNDGQDPNPQPTAYLYSWADNDWSQVASIPTPGNGVPVVIDGLRFMTGSQIPIGPGTVQSYLIAPEPGAIGLAITSFALLARFRINFGQTSRRRREKKPIVRRARCSQLPVWDCEHLASGVHLGW